MSAPDRPTREQVEAALASADIAIGPSCIETHGVALVARTPQSTEPSALVLAAEKACAAKWAFTAGRALRAAIDEATGHAAPLPAVPDGEDAACSCCGGDPLTVCAACEQHACWAGRFMCEFSRTAGTKQAAPARGGEDVPARLDAAAELAALRAQRDAVLALADDLAAGETVGILRGETVFRLRKALRADDA